MGNYCKECFNKQEEIERLKQENKELKAEIDRCNDEFGCDEMAKYKQALEEIREMFRECCYNANFMNNCSEKCKFYKSCNGELSAIRDKINEALND